MISILINFFTVILLLVSVFLVLIVLAQKTKDGGMGSALGGGMTESTFGAETGNVLTKTTRKLAIAFFVLALGLYLGNIYVRKHSAKSDKALPTIEAPASPAAPAAAAPVTPAPAGDETKKP